MRWDGFFDDLEDQLASEWEAERAALETEAERLRIARLTLRERIATLAGRATPVATAVFEFCDGEAVRADVAGVGADWVALTAVVARGGTIVAPLHAVTAIALPHADLLSSARGGAPASRLSERITFGFALRDLARRRVGVRVHTVSGRVLGGTIDRAGADHLDLALHDAGSPRRAADVTGHRIVPFAAIARVDLEGPPPAL